MQEVPLHSHMLAAFVGDNIRHMQEVPLHSHTLAANAAKKQLEDWYKTFLFQRDNPTGLVMSLSGFVGHLRPKTGRLMGYHTKFFDYTPERRNEDTPAPAGYLPQSL
jgi:hypothetical protein